MSLFPLTRRKTSVRVLPKFPAQVVAGAGIAITKSGGVYTFSATSTTLASLTDALISSPTAGQLLRWNGTKWVNADLIHTEPFRIDGGGVAITTGIKGDLTFDFAGTIQQVTMLADQSGSIVVDIWKDSYCVDVETEALSPRGWLTGSDVRVDDELLGFSEETGKTSWQKPTEMFIDRHYSGSMIRIGRDGSRIDALVTPNHAWPVVRLYGRAEVRMPVERIETKDLPPKGLLLRSAPYDGPSVAVLSDPLVRLAAWFFTEGSTRADGTIVSITQSERANSENCAAIRADLIAVGAQWSQLTGDGKPRRTGQRGSFRRTGLWVHEHAREDETIQFCITGEHVDQLVRLFVEKVPTAEFIAALTSDQARIFVETALLGDGDGSNIFYQHDEHRMSAFMAIAVLAGYSPSLDRAGVTCSLRRTRPFTWIKDTPRTVEHYRGTIWCPTMPTGYWVARRRGKVFITGNSNYPPTVADTITAAAKPTISAALKSQDATLTGWTKTFLAGDTFRFNVDSAATITRLLLSLKVLRT